MLDVRASDPGAAESSSERVRNVKNWLGKLRLDLESFTSLYY